MSGLFPLAPVFMDLIGRAVVILGGGADVAALASRLAAGGASVLIFDPAPADALEGIAGVRLVRRRWRSADFKGVALVIAGPKDRRPIRARAAAKAARAVFCALGAAELSDIGFGGAMMVGPVSVGIGATGLHPTLETLVRQRIEASVPASLAGFLMAAQRQTGFVLERLSEAQASAFWRDAGWAASGLDVDDWDGWIRDRLASAPVQA